MIRLFLILGIVFLLVVFLKQLRKYFALDNKEDELTDAIIEGELVDIDKEIALEKARQKTVYSQINDINNEENKND